MESRKLERKAKGKTIANPEVLKAFVLPNQPTNQPTNQHKDFFIFLIFNQKL
ncbi:hypothetical protein RJD24_19190 [Bacillaceae bacterium IKA-2]|nr:hypothetical protein RJD24_19190 [Bacillaceae bacterium IKA-2]